RAPPRRGQDPAPRRGAGARSAPVPPRPDRPAPWSSRWCRRGRTPRCWSSAFPPGNAVRALGSGSQSLYDQQVSYSRRERLALCDLLDKTGPDAPTLCEGWTTGDLAAHLVLREHRPDAAGGVLGGPLAGYTARVQQRIKERTRFADLVRTI